MKLPSFVTLLTAVLVVASPIVPGVGDSSAAASSSPLLTELQAAPTVISFPKTYSLPNKFKGDSLVQIHADGAVRFRTHFKNDGALTQHFAIVCAVLDKGGNGYTFARKGKVFGKA